MHAMNFHTGVLPCLTKPIVLVIGDNDKTTPLQVDARYERRTHKPPLDGRAVAFQDYSDFDYAAWRAWLNDSRVAHIFVEHLDESQNATKVTPLPVGVNPAEFLALGPANASRMLHATRENVTSYAHMRPRHRAATRRLDTPRLRGDASFGRAVAASRLAVWSFRAASRRSDASRRRGPASRPSSSPPGLAVRTIAATLVAAQVSKTPTARSFCR